MTHILKIIASRASRIDFTNDACGEELFEGRTTGARYGMTQCYLGFDGRVESKTGKEVNLARLKRAVMGEHDIAASYYGYGFYIVGERSLPEPRKAGVNNIGGETTQTLLGRALKILMTGNIEEKVRQTLELAEDWRTGKVHLIKDEKETIVSPDHPARPPHQSSGKAGGGGGKRVTFIHGVAHAESYAIDLMWDIICRFSDEKMPKEFYDDWVRIAGEEAMHFTRWSERLRALGSWYGALPTHESLWESAAQTKDNLYARLAVVHMVHEARGLDVAGIGLARLQGLGDEESAAILRANVKDEITHVGAAVRWFSYLCERDGLDRVQHFHKVVREVFRGYLKPPFDKNARLQAGMTEEWYEPLAQPTS